MNAEGVLKLFYSNVGAIDGRDFKLRIDLRIPDGLGMGGRGSNGRSLEQEMA
jgi:hypothetical protein